jgi:hypothetical protein
MVIDTAGVGDSSQPILEGQLEAQPSRSHTLHLLHAAAIFLRDQARK